MDQDQLYSGVMEERGLTPDILVSEEGVEKCGRVYLFTNELLGTPIDKINFHGKSVLGVAGCGDFMISAISNGCEDFTGVDISIPACFFAELKFAGIKRLDYDTFRKFFGLTRKLAKAYPDPATSFKEEGCVERLDFFSAETFEVLKPELSETAQRFFDSVIYSHCVGTEGEELPFAMQYLFPQMPFNWNMDYVPYLQDRKAFDMAQARMERKPLLYPEDLRKVTGKSERRFDLIYASNVHQWFDQDLGDGGGVLFLEDLAENLNPEGKLLVYGINEYNDVEDLAYMDLLVENIEQDKSSMLKEVLKQGVWMLRGVRGREMPLSYYKAFLIKHREDFL